MSNDKPGDWHRLPIFKVVPEVLSGLTRGNVILHAEPGAGKSTGLPMALLQQATIDTKIIMLEPRRLAARAVAARLADQLGETPGRQIGLRMRGDTRTSANARTEVVTEGVLTRMLQADPLLEDVGLVIFDEFHERSLHADLGLTLCLEVQRELRSDLRLLLMSATLDTKLLNTTLDGAAQVYCPTRQHPVDVSWVGESKAPLPARAAKAVTNSLNKDSGDVLVFLPGVAEIENTARLLQTDLPDKVRLYRLHGGVDAADQRAATAPAIASQRRVILATSIAETSITIDGVRVVIDSGLERRGRIDSSTGAARLETVTASQASATQRSGRAGRTAPGVCYRLWSENGHNRRASNWQPEILRADLAPLLVELGQWGAGIDGDLPWPEPPPAASLARAEDLLVRLGIWKDGQLTDHGRAVSELPVHPRLAHMLLWAAKHGASETACKIAVILEEGDRSRGTADLEQRLHRPMTKTRQRRVKQLQALSSHYPASNDNPPISVLLAQAYPDWIAQRRPSASGSFALSCGAGAIIDSEDSLAHSEWLSVASLGGSGREARIYTATPLNIDQLNSWSPNLFSTGNHLEWDDDRERVVAEQQTSIGKLLVKTSSLSEVSSFDRAAALLSGVRQRGLACLPWTDNCREWQSRVSRIRALPDLRDNSTWPIVDDDTLYDQLENWLLPWLDGIASLKALSQLKLLQILNAMLDYQQQCLLDELLPTHYTVPSGSNIALRYAESGNPVLSVKLQEMFGCTENPTVARGHIPLKIELLSPARRAVQVTEDLANFWHNSYPAVKKDMAGRYPKHHWPDDPLSAPPTAGAKRKRR